MNAHRAARRLTIAVSGLAVTATAGLGTGTAAAAGSELVYTGQSSITIATCDYCDLTTGQGRPVGKRTYTGPVTLIVSDPVFDGDGGAEHNPLHFTLQTDQQNGTGAFWISSAQVFTTPETARKVAFTYWSVDHDGETGALKAELIEDHREEGRRL